MREDQIEGWVERSVSGGCEMMRSEMVDEVLEDRGGIKSDFLQKKGDMGKGFERLYFLERGKI